MANRRNYFFNVLPIMSSDVHHLKHSCTYLVYCKVFTIIKKHFIKRYAVVKIHAWVDWCRYNSPVFVKSAIKTI